MKTPHDRLRDYSHNNIFGIPVNAILLEYDSLKRVKDAVCAYSEKRDEELYALQESITPIPAKPTEAYLVCSADTTDRLEDVVNSAIEHGYDLCGGVSIYARTTPAGRDIPVFYQAVVLAEST